MARHMGRTYGWISATAVVAVIGLMGVSQALAAASYTINFDDGKMFRSTTQALAKLTKDSAEVIDGAASLRLDSRKSSQEWNEQYWTDPKQIKLEAGATYTIDFDYKLLQEDEAGEFYYFLARSVLAGTGENDRGWTQWTPNEGMDGHKTLTITLGDFADYHLTLGIHGKGAMVIDNIEIAAAD